RGEKGAVLVLVAAALLVLTGMAAIAIDGGLAYNERRSTQNAADNAALAGAWALCNGDDPVAAALDSAQLNGFAPPQVEEPEVEDSTVRVRIHTNVETGFGRTQGATEIGVISEAIAECVEGSGGIGPVGLFAKGPSCTLDSGGNNDLRGMVYSGGDLDVNGNASYFGPVHADGDLAVNGNNRFRETVHGQGHLSANGNLRFDKEVTYGTSNNIWGNVDIPPGSPRQVSKVLGLEYPVSAQASDYAARPAGVPASLWHYHPGNWTIGGNTDIEAGLHYVNGSVTMSGNTDADGPITIVATGKITIGGNAGPFEAYLDHILLFSDHGSKNCNQVAIDLNGNKEMDGLIFAPNGRIDIHGNSVTGSVIGWSILTRGNFGVTAVEDYLPSGADEVRLVE
ncbi:MAG TPA: pilus assembly protein TadG-related protein, partial [Acidimicrobiia bacterium]|nr:pilus assembly protein TadG-related protein [Acidimicrobiia bacterium]